MDYSYIANNLASLSGLPVRIYQDERFIQLFHYAKFKPDLAILEEREIFKNKDTVSYYMTDTFLFYGLFRIKNTDVSYLIGPVSQTRVNKKNIRNILLSIGEPLHREKELNEYLNSIPTYPLRIFLQILCTFNYFFNNEKRDVDEFIIKEMPLVEYVDNHKEESEEFVHNTYEVEKKMLDIVKRGNIDELNILFSNPLSGRAGTLSNDGLRQQKNLFICTTTLVTRAAIEGGLDKETALTLSDVYIQKAELINDIALLMTLQGKMIYDFTKRVNQEVSNPDIRKIRSYILEHINQKITTNDLAHLVGINRNYLNELFKRELHMTPFRYVTSLRIEEAKRLLMISNKSLEEIASALGFSSQAHFQSVFKKETGLTPLNYKKKMS
ncbi:MAG: helix-turn-helix domain-containing protein [Holdemanella sp.]|nr:helix-turn-helix domain-containing protein [Holdemanella sp.]